MSRTSKSAIRVEVAESIRSFKFNQAEFKAFVRVEGGKDLTRRAIRVQSAAIQNASGRPGPNVITGRLRGSITWRLGEDFKGIYVDVGTAVEYAIFVELGTVNAPAYPFLAPALSAGRI